MQRDKSGTRLCKHLRQYHKCAECNDFVCTVEGCHMEGHYFASKQRLQTHVESYHSERGRQRKKRKEEAVHRYLESQGYTFDREQTVHFCGSCVDAKYARPDFILYRSWGMAIVEVDEHQHSDRPLPCETSRMMNVLHQAITQDSARKIHFIRYNPDVFRLSGVKQRISQEERRDVLRKTIEQEPDKMFQLTYLYYDRSGPLPDVCHDPAYTNHLRACVTRSFEG